MKSDMAWNEMIFGNKYNPPEQPDYLAKNEEKAVPLQANLQVYIPPKNKQTISHK